MNSSEATIPSGRASGILWRMQTQTTLGRAAAGGMSLQQDGPVALITRVVGPFCCQLRELPLPTIAAVAGPALGFGLRLALLAHEGRQLQKVFSTSDLHDSISPFQQRRKPVFTGR
jgi:hypothetical protein